MDDRHIKKLLVPSFLIVVFSIVFVYEFKVAIDRLFFKKKHILIIGILSAPGNFEQRISIRKTWLNLLPEISGSSYFIIGTGICDVPPYDRPDPYSCTYRPFALPENATPLTEFSTMKINREISNETALKQGFTGFSFYVRSNIMVKKLGILKELLSVLKSEIQVKLVSAINNNRILARVTFSPELLKESPSEVLVKAIKPVKLNAKEEAFITISVPDIEDVVIPSCNFALWQKEPYVIEYIHLWQHDSVIPVPFTVKSCTFLFMEYTVIDTEKIMQKMGNKTSRLKQWQRFNKKLSCKLKNESKTFNDILFVDVIDTYRNLSLKMTEFYKRILATEYFHYILKADDDSFIDLLRVHHHLMEVNKQIDQEISLNVNRVTETGMVAKLRLSKFWWWSFFKEFWKVERAGKWRESQYRSASYPTFPCGGGYVVNKGIVDYIANNEQNLHYFQGEDVSLGIWLSPLSVIQYKTPREISELPSYRLQKKIIQKYKGKSWWAQFKMNKNLSELSSDLCDWTCSKIRRYNRPLCNKVQLSVDKMYDTWAEYIHRGFL